MAVTRRASWSYSSRSPKDWYTFSRADGLTVARIFSVARAQLAEMSEAGIRVTPGDPVIADHDSFILVADRPTLHLPYGTVAAVRLTMALSRVDDALLIEQMQMSVPAPNEDVIHQTLTV